MLEDKESSWFEGLDDKDDYPKARWMRRVYPRVHYRSKKVLNSSTGGKLSKD